MTTKRLVVSIVIILFLLCPFINFYYTPPTKTSEFQLNNYGSYSTSGSSSRSRGTMLDLNNNADVTFFGVDRKDFSGDTLWTGDINGDNVDELLVGTPWASNLAGNVSVIYTTFKNQFDLVQDAELVIKGKNPFAAQDHIAVCTGDIDGDGKEDMIMGACYSDSGPGATRVTAGELWVVYGDTKSNLGNFQDLSTNADITIFGAETGDTSGYAVCAGDINGDGKDDILITSKYAVSGTCNGTIDVIFGDTRPSLGSQIDLLNSPLTIYGIDIEDYAGSTLATGDIDGDNREDIIIGAQMAEGPSNSRTECGEVYVIYGDTKANLGSQKYLDTDADLVIYGADDHDHFGHSIAAGDINGDGKDDIIVGAENSDGVANSRSNSGETYIIYGSGSLTGTWDLNSQAASVTIYGADIGDRGGSAVAAAKINNDNFEDLLIGARYSDGYNNQREDAGEAYVIYGDTNANLGTVLDLAADSDINLYGVSPDDHTGSTVALGDIDGNGKHDLIIGAEDANGERGKVYLVYTDPPIIKTDLFNLIDGHGTNNDICYALYQPYTFNVKVIDEYGFDDLEDVSLSLELGTFGEIEYQWQAQPDSFTEVNDPNGYATIISTSSDSTNDNIDSWTLDFKLNFNFNFPTEEPVSCKVFCKGFKGLEHSVSYTNIFKVENDLEFTGALLVQNSTQKTLTENSWTRGGETLSWTGLTVIYEGSTDLYPADKYFNVTLTDEYGGSWQDTSSTGEVFYIESEEAAISGSLSHSLAITEIPNSGADVSVLEAFITNVDAELPPAPEKVVIHADSYTDPQVNYDNDNHIYVSWTPEPDLESEIAGYYYSQTNHEFTANGIWTTGHTGEFTGVPEGKVDVYVWAIDNAGNIGSATNGSILIDLQAISFENAAPSSTVWQLTQTPTCSIRVIDEGGSGLDFEAIQYSISEGGNTNYGNWSYAESLVIISDDSVDCSVQPYFGNGGENYIKWRAKDLAGNGYTESEDYMIKVDSQKVTFRLTTPQPKIWQNYKTVSCSVTISDLGGSGVNAASIEYAVSTDNVYSYGGWQSPGLTNDAESIVHTVEIGFQEGNENYIKWRAADVAGNDYAVSADYNIWVNTEPQLIISAPEDYSRFLADTRIWFDASESTDFDGDTLSFYWVSDIEGAIGYSAQFNRMLSPGTHRITVYLDDGHTHNISKLLTVTSYETDTDSDGTPDHLDDDDDDDNMPDWWEELYGLNSKYGGDVNTDIDKDGYSNYEEFELNSSPLNASDPPSNGGPDTEDETTSEDSEGIGDEWIIVLVIIVVILIVLIVMVLIFIKKAQSRAQAASEAEKPKSEKGQEPPKEGLPGLPPPKEAPVGPGSASSAQQPSPDLSTSLPPLQSDASKSLEQKSEQ